MKICLQKVRNLIISAIVGYNNNWIVGLLPLLIDKCRMQVKTTQSKVTNYKQIPQSDNATICTMPSLRWSCRQTNPNNSNHYNTNHSEYPPPPPDAPLSSDPPPPTPNPRTAPGGWSSIVFTIHPPLYIVVPNPDQMIYPHPHEVKLP